MARIIDIKTDLITIGMDNGEILEVFPGELNFSPRLNDEVEVFRSDDGDRIIVTKKQYQQQNIYQQTRSFTSDPVYGSYSNYQLPVVRGKYVNKWIYLALIFFFGTIGLQHFYSGKIKKGVLSFFFYWTFIPTILSFIEFFKVLFKEADQNERIFIEHH